MTQKAMADIADLDIEAYNFEVPESLIAQTPAEPRGGSRLMVLDRSRKSVVNAEFSDLVKYLGPGDCVVINKTKVVPVRMFGKKKTGGKVEILFLNPDEFDKLSQKVLLKSWIKPGTEIMLEGGLKFIVGEKTPAGETVIELSEKLTENYIDKYGVMPLPPYIKRDHSRSQGLENDNERYQTVYAKNKGSIAAPTAGLHFTEALIDELKSKGVNFAQITLHVGWGTFKPVHAQKINEHTMLPEYYDIAADAAESINNAVKSGKKVVAVGTTSVRALESAGSLSKDITACSGNTSIFIYPGYNFKVVNSFITNFHVPKSTPLLMACAFAGTDFLREAYKEAVKQKYRFFSYGDAMLII